MTVSSTTNKHYYNGTGSQTSFPYAFKVFAKTDLTVYVDGVLKTVDTDFTVSDVGIEDGGNIVFSVAPVIGTGNIAIIRQLALSQSVDLVQYGKFDAEVIEAQYDKLTMMAQQLQEQADRTIRFSATVSDAGGIEITDTVAERSGKVLAYDANGDLSVANELGDWQGNWTTTTIYAVRDLVMDSATNNVYTCLVGHTAGTLATDVSAGKWALVIDAVAVAASASAAAADLVLTNADVVLTNADVVLTNADVVLTHADVVLAEADKVQTGLDRAAVAADLLLTNQDTLDTAADVVLTNADVVLTNADVVATADKLPLAGGAMTGAITTNSTFDGRDVSVDGTKLDTITIGTTVQAYDADTAKTDVVQTYTASQIGEVTALTDAASIATDLALSNNFAITLGGNRTLANPTNITAGQSGSIFVTQDGTGSRTLAYGTNFKFVAGTAPTLSTAASSVDRIDYVVASATQIHAVASLDVK